MSAASPTYLKVEVDGVLIRAVKAPASPVYPYSTMYPVEVDGVRRGFLAYSKYGGYGRSSRKKGWSLVSLLPSEWDRGGTTGLHRVAGTFGADRREETLRQIPALIAKGVMPTADEVPGIVEAKAAELAAAKAQRAAEVAASAEASRVRMAAEKQADEDMVAGLEELLETELTNFQRAAVVRAIAKGKR